MVEWQAADKQAQQRRGCQKGELLTTTVTTVLHSTPELYSSCSSFSSPALACHCRNTPLGQKTRTERKGTPCFSALVEVLSYTRWRVHLNVARSADALLAGEQPVTQLREMQGSKILVTIEKAEPPSLGVHSRQPGDGGASLAWSTWMQQLQAYSK